MARVGRPPSCDCGECKKCKHRAYMKKWYDAKTPEERQAIIARRDKDAARRADRARHHRDLEKRRARFRDRKASAKDAEAKRLWAERNPEKRRAHHAVQQAIRSGNLERGYCEVCGTDENIHAHHEDYSRPLDVRWLCAAHHAREHVLYPDEWAEAS